MRNDDRMTPLMQALLYNLSILAVWYLAEYAQFGQLQMHRKCDDLVFVLYFMLTWYLAKRSYRNDIRE